MKSALMGLLCAVTLGSTAHAGAESDIFTCKPGASPNGLGIAKLVLDVSNEDPEAKMTITYEHGARAVANMAYDGDFPELDFIPNGSRDGDVSVSLRKSAGRLTASVKSESIDTFSVLDCSRK